VGLRAEQLALTRRRIIDTVVELSTEPDLGPISVAEVARRSGVSQATIYRHFPSREALVAAAANDRLLDRVDGGTDEIGMDEERAHLEALWADLAANLLLARQSLVSEAGRELRRARFDHIKPVYDRALDVAGVDADSDEVRQLVSCAHLLTSALAFLDLHDRQGLSVTEAVDAAMCGTEALLRATGLDPTQLRIRFFPPDTPEDHVA
jgi:AcrR family transcriptional regulator